MRLSLNTVLGGLCVLLAGLIIGGTLVSFLTGRARPGIYLRRAERPPAPEVPVGDGYIALDQLRIMTRATDAEEGIPVVVKPWFSFNKADLELREELYQKTRQLEAIVRGFFSQYTYAELLAMGEDGVKAGLEQNINEALVLGKISGVFFDTYIFFD